MITETYIHSLGVELITITIWLPSCAGLWCEVDVHALWFHLYLYLSCSPSVVVSPLPSNSRLPVSVFRMNYPT